MQMNPAKQKVISEVDPIIELLTEVHDRLAAIPRSATAARQLSVLIAKLRAWKIAYEPGETSSEEKHRQTENNDELFDLDTKMLIARLVQNLECMTGK